MTENIDKTNELDIYKEMYRITENIKNRFIPFVKKTLVERNIDIKYFDESDIFSIMKTLIFGVDKESSIKKVDLVKNKNLMKLFFLNLPNIYSSISFIKDIFVQIDEFIWAIDKMLFEKIYKPTTDFSNSILNEKEITRFMNIIETYTNECAFIRSSLSSLKDIIYNTAVIDNRSTDDIMANLGAIKTLKKDTLKRYYFYEVYEIKNSFKYFSINDMFFGETNSIMRLYNNIMDFIFKDFVFIYNTIESNLSEIIKKSTK